MSSHSSHHSSSHHSSSHHSSSHHSSSGRHGGGHKGSGGDLFTDLASGLIMAGVASSMEKKHHYSENGQINPYAVSAAKMASGRMRTTEDLLRTGAMLGSLGAFDDPPERNTHDTYDTPASTRSTYVPRTPRPQTRTPVRKDPAKPPEVCKGPELQAPDPLFAPGEELVQLTECYAWRMNCLDGTPYGLSPWSYSSRRDYERAIASVKTAREAPIPPRTTQEPGRAAFRPWQTSPTSQGKRTSAPTLRYCRVQLDFSQETVYCRTQDESLTLGDTVHVRLPDGTVGTGTIVAVEFYLEDKVPASLQKAPEIPVRNSRQERQLEEELLLGRLTKDLRRTLQVRLARLQTLAGADAPARVPDLDPTPEEMAHCMAQVYAKAQKDLEQAQCEQEFWETGETFHAVSGYRDAEEKCLECGRQALRLHEKALESMGRLVLPPEQLATVGEDYIVCVTAQGNVLLATSDANLMNEWRSLKDWAGVVQIASEGRSLTALGADGRVKTAGKYISRYEETADWKDIAMTACGSYYVVGLKGDGTVTAAGREADPRCAVQDWTQVVDIVCSLEAAFGLQADGTVVCAGPPDLPYGDLDHWTDIAQVLPGGGEVLALKRDGTILHGYDREKRTCAEDGALSQWSQIVKLQRIGSRLLGLRADGTVWEYNTYTGISKRQPWTDIIAISCSIGHYMGLRADGTVLLNGTDRYDQRTVANWNNIIALASGGDTLAGVRTDGTVVTTNPRLDTSSWKLFQSYASLEQERAEMVEHAQAQSLELTAQLKQQIQEDQAELKRMSGFLYRLLVSRARQKADNQRRKITQEYRELERILGCVCSGYGDRLHLEEE